MVTHQVALLAGVVFAGILCQWFAWLVRIPAILFLLLTGIIAGPVTGLLDSSLMLGDLLFPFISLSVAMILFEGSLTLKLKEISGLQKVVRRMILIGVPVTWLITSVATKFSLNLSWGISFLFGSIVVVTGPTVITPMLRTVRPTATIANILRWEGIVIDPVGATLALLVYEFLLATTGNGEAIGHSLFIFSKIVGVGLFTGILSGWTLGIILRKHWLPEFLHNVGTLAWVGAFFALSNFIQEESGLLTVTIMGMWLANMKDVPIDDIINFKESISVLLISVLFIVLASRVDLHQLVNLGWCAVFIFIAVQFIARPLSVMIASYSSTLSWPERHLLAWIAPRGIVAAAISSLFAISLEKQGFAGADLLVPLTFMVILGTVTLQSATSTIIAKALGVRETFPKGVLIIGSNIVSIEIGKALKTHNFRPVIVDRDWERILDAKSKGLETYLGEAVSEYSQKGIDLIGIGNMLAVTPIGSLNALSCLHYRMEIGENNVYSIMTRKNSENNAENHTARWRFLFGENISISSVREKISEGWIIKSEKLSKDFTYENYNEKFRNDCIKFFSISSEEELHVFTAGDTYKPPKGSTIIHLIKE